MKINVPQRLSVRLTWYTVVWALILGLIINMFQVTVDYFSASSAMDADIRALMEISHSPASQIAYNLDTRLAEELLEGLLRHPAIVRASIAGPNGAVMAEHRRELPASPYRWLSDLLFGTQRRYTDRLEVDALADIELGVLRLEVDTYHYGTSFLRRAAQTLLTGFAKSLILSVILLIVFYLVLTKPLFRVIEFLSRVDTDEPERIRLPSPRGHDHDEIGLLVRITNQHLDTIGANLQKLRRAEGRLKGYNEQLAQTVADRTREISDKNVALQQSNRALIDAKEDAVSRAQARADFLASMSHEIRTPLNGLLGMLSLSMEEQMSPSQRNRLEIAHTAGQNLLSLLNDILDISKVEAGKLDIERIEFNLREIAEQSALLMADQGRRKGVEVVSQIAPDLPDRFIGDPTRIRQVINNLLNNGIKFTPRGEVRLGIDYSKDEVRISVSDTGIGLSVEDQRKIFAPFAQANSETTRRFGGTGLGLTLCRQLVERMQGQITIDSRVNRGTTFLIRIPLETAPAQHGPVSGSALAGRRIALRADQDNPHLKPLRDQLLYWGVNLVEKPSGLLTGSAVEQSEDPPVELLITDSNLDGDGHAPGEPPTVRFGTPALVETDSSTPTIAVPLTLKQLTDSLLRALEPSGTSPAVASPDSARGEQKPLRVLLVEDNRVNQIVAGGMLKKLGHEVDVADNGNRALVALRQQSYDAILMDIQMPVMDGFETARQIRSSLKLDKVPIIAVTANVMQGDREACLDAGMDDYITKPYSLAALKQKLNQWVPA